MPENSYESFGSSSIYVSVVHNKIAINNAADLNLSILNNWFFVNSVGWDEHDTVHESTEGSSGILKAQHAQRGHARSSELMPFQSKSGNIDSQLIR